MSDTNPVGSNQVLKKVYIEATKSLRVTSTNPGGGSSSVVNSFTTLGSSTPKDVSIGTSSTVILALNSNRLYTHIINKSSEPVWIQYQEDAVVGKGIRLLPNSVWKITAEDLFLGRISGIAQNPITIEVLEGVQ